MSIPLTLNLSEEENTVLRAYNLGDEIKLTTMLHKGKQDLKAAIHQYDFTLRPQIVRKEVNPSYHRIITEFLKLTGIGAVLNTSFNLHGYPIVMSPKDALEVLKNSGLKYLAISDFLVCKKGH